MPSYHFSDTFIFLCNYFAFLPPLYSTDQMALTLPQVGRALDKFYSDSRTLLLFFRAFAHTQSKTKTKTCMHPHTHRAKQKASPNRFSEHWYYPFEE